MAKKNREELEAFAKKMHDEGAAGFASGLTPWETWDDFEDRVGSRVWQGTAEQVNEHAPSKPGFGDRVLTAMTVLAVATLAIGIAGVYMSQNSTLHFADNSTQLLPAAPVISPGIVTPRENAQIAVNAASDPAAEMIDGPQTDTPLTAGTATLTTGAQAGVQNDNTRVPGQTVTEIIPAAMKGLSTATAVMPATNSAVRPPVTVSTPDQPVTGDYKMAAAREVQPPATATAFAGQNPATVKPATLGNTAAASEDNHTILAALNDLPATAAGVAQAPSLNDLPAAAASVAQAPPLNDLPATAARVAGAPSLNDLPATAAGVAGAPSLNDLPATAAGAARAPSTVNTAPVAAPEPALIMASTTGTAAETGITGQAQPLILSQLTTRAIPPPPPVSVPNTSQSAQTGNPGAWSINLASYSKQAAAERMKGRFLDKGVNADHVIATVNGATIHRLRVTGFANRRTAMAQSEIIKAQLGLKEAWITKQ